jgi:ribonucleoside-diphosphate reductase alpha chain
MTTTSLAQCVQHLRVIKRNGQAVSFEPSKISDAITKAMFAAEGASGGDSVRIGQTVLDITNEIVQKFCSKLPTGGQIIIEDIQDQVELCLMRHGHQQVARSYVLYREAHAKQRQLDEQTVTSPDQGLEVVNEHKQQHFLSFESIKQRIELACEGYQYVDAQMLFEQSKHNLYQGMKLADVDTALLISARPMIETEPNYSYVCAQLLKQQLSHEVTESLGLSIKYQMDAGSDNFYLSAFTESILQGVELELLDPVLLEFDLTRLAQAIQPERDSQFNYLGMQTLYDRYFMHIEDKRLEMPQVFFMRVAMGLAINESEREARAIDFYRLLSSFDYMSSTPTLFNSGTRRSQLSSCYLTTVDDDLGSIYSAIGDNAQLSKWAGGLGNDWTNVRGMGAKIKGTNGKSQGVIPFLKVVNDTAVAVNQGGKRKGAVCAYLESWHIDIEEFLELRKNTGDERRRAHDMNSANWIPDLFMKRVFEDSQWTLFSPDDVPTLHQTFGVEFESEYRKYESLVESGKITLFRKIPAKQLWQKMLSMLFETGHPWITFKDPCNIRSPQQHCGVIHSSNLCTEITLNTSDDEIAVCNLGSVNLAQHIVDGVIDKARLQTTIQTAIRMLDNVIDINFYPVEKAKTSNLKHRPIGLGVMGFQDALYKKSMSYASIDAVQFADESMELISFYAIQASIQLAKERGKYPSFDDSLWDQGILPIDSQAQLKSERGETYCTFNEDCLLDWSEIRQQLAQYGIRNSNVMAIAPTATISNIVGVSQSIEPTYQNMYVKSNLSGEFMVVNQALVDELKQLNLWDTVMVNDLKYFDGSVQHIERIPQSLKSRFATAFEIDSRWLVEAASRRQKWLDQAQSLNLYMAEPSGLALDNLYKLAWSRGLKTTYYLRSLGATQAEKLGVNDNSESMSSLDSAVLSASAAPDNQSDWLSGQKQSFNSVKSLIQEVQQRQQERSKNDADQSSVDSTTASLAPSLHSKPKPNLNINACSILEPDCEACQ